MAITYGDYIYSCYRSQRGIHEALENNYSDILDYDRNQAFGNFMSIDISGDEFEIPCIYKYIVAKVLAKRPPFNEQIDIINIPMVVAQICPDTKSANPLLKDFFRGGSTSGSFLSKKKAGDTVYIGGEGLIMYEDFTPLVMFTLKVRKVTMVNGAVKYTPVREIMRINPITFSKNDLMAKHIRSTMIGKVIPLKTNWNVAGYPSWSLRSRRLLNYNDILTTDQLEYKFEIVIDDFSKYFVAPTIPDCTFDSSKVNKFLSDNYNDLMKSAYISI